MGRTLLAHKNYLVESGTLFEDFETIEDWTKGASGQITIDSDRKTGSGSLKLTSASGGNCFATKTISLDMNRNWGVGVWLYIEDASKLQQFGVYLSNDSGLTSYHSRFVTNGSVVLQNGWQYIQLPKPDWSTVGTPSWNGKIRLRVRIDAQANQVATVKIDSLYIDRRSRPKLLFTFDDGWASQYTEAYNYMATKGLVGSCFLETQNQDQSNYMTTAQVTEMYNAGWDLGTHGHFNLTTFNTQAEMEADIAYNKAYLTSNNFTRNNCHLHYAYPLGGFNDTAIAALQAQGMLTARTTRSGGSVYQPTVVDIFNPYTLRIQDISNTTTLAQAKAKVDLAERSGGTIILMLHKIVANPTDAIEWSITNFKALCDYVKLKSEIGVFDVVTVSDWYNGLSNIGGRPTASDRSSD
jgi:peptidoglycan/xylan/chitin deacetylase (PgdA/CDA1 family)